MSGECEDIPISQKSTRTVLFVCTGNTCRSPMAEAIARHKTAARGAPGARVHVISAGAFATLGAPATAEAVRAVQAMGASLDGHTSKPLTRDLLARADIIFGLTRAHVDAVTRLDPTAADRVYLLDPDGADIADPLGHSQDVYDRTARTLDRLIDLRFQELDI